MSFYNEYMNRFLRFPKIGKTLDIQKELFAKLMYKKNLWLLLM